MWTSMQDLRRCCLLEFSRSYFAAKQDKINHLRLTLTSTLSDLTLVISTTRIRGQKVKYTNFGGVSIHLAGEDQKGQVYRIKHHQTFKDLYTRALFPEILLSTSGSLAYRTISSQQSLGCLFRGLQPTNHFSISRCRIQLL
jgi:hypothetical protein